MAIDVKRFIARFIEEAREHLRRIDEGLRALDADPADHEAVNAVFRSAHTIKGSSRMLKLTPITETAHRIEDVLGAMRDGTLVCTPEISHLLQRGSDALSAQVEAAADGGNPLSVDEALNAALEALLKPVAARSAGAELAQVTAAVLAGDVHVKAAETVRIPLAKLDELIRLMGEVVSSHARLRQRLADVRRLEREAAATGLTSFAAFVRDLRDDVFGQERLMEALHGRALIMRMLPVAIVFEPASRLVRELGRSLGKDVECTVAGTEIELDRLLIDRLNDPIVHLLRNAVDHGLEEPGIREARGKPRYGRIHLSARQDGGQVVIEVADDGGGLPLEAIRDKAVRKGFVTAEQAAAMSETEVIDLIFRPGFSTSPILTDVSGRGVGMDVVKRCIVDELQGVVSVETAPGKGATFTLRLPLSLAVMRVLLVSTGGRTFGVTSQYVAEILRLPADRLLSVAGREAALFDNEFIPMEPLSELLDMPVSPVRRSGDLLLVVLKIRNEKLAVRVDELVDERDMVLKPLPEHLRQLPLVSGMVMTGRDELISILHAPALVTAARRTRAARREEPAAEAPAKMRILVVDDSLNTREIERDVLEAHGYDVTLAEDGLDGLRKARDGDFEAVLTDVEMPKMDGFSLVKALRQEDAYRDRPIIIVTSRAKEEDKRRGIQVGADAYIVKGSFDTGGLVETLRNLLG